jgi:hypothetical protein
MNSGRWSKAGDIAGAIVLITDYGCYPADADYVEHVLKLHKKKTVNGYEYPTKDVLIMLMFNDFMGYLANDERDDNEYLDSVIERFDRCSTPKNVLLLIEIARAAQELVAVGGAHAARRLGDALRAADLFPKARHG